MSRTFIFDICDQINTHAVWTPIDPGLALALLELTLGHFGAHSERETPVPIPNTAVKPLSGYNTWVLALGK